VASLARPGGNLTGINFVSAELAAKRVELLHELIPGAKRVALLVNPADTTNTETMLREVGPAARAIGWQIQVLNADTSGAIDAAFGTFERERPDALFVGSSPFFTSRRVQLVQLTARHAIPAAYVGRQFSEIGGLMSYGANLTDAWRQFGVYTGRVLKGAKPADLPVVQANKFELVINHQTARMLGLTVCHPSLCCFPDIQGARMHRAVLLGLIGSILGWADRKGDQWLCRRGDLGSQRGEEPKTRYRSSFEGNEGEDSR
jgi:putative ABC transport system substrate-binding protein